MHVETADKLIVMGGVRKCVICELGFPKVGSLEPEVRLKENEKIPHRYSCAECGIEFVSRAHVRFHLRYSHDSKCQHCHSYCDSRCAGYYGLAKEAAGSEAMEEGREEKNETVKDTELELERLTGELTAEHLDIVEKFAATIDVGYEYFEADAWCRRLYFPSPIMPKRTPSKDLYWWIFMDS